jgi:hypothetical protein
VDFQTFFNMHAQRMEVLCAKKPHSFIQTYIDLTVALHTKSQSVIIQWADRNNGESKEGVFKKLHTTCVVCMSVCCLFGRGWWCSRSVQQDAHDKCVHLSVRNSMLFEGCVMHGQLQGSTIKTYWPTSDYERACPKHYHQPLIVADFRVVMSETSHLIWVADVWNIIPPQGMGISTLHNEALLL